MTPVLPYKISVLVFLENPAGEQLLILRRQAPNFGNWSPIGGKLEMATGESPFECAARETFEETGLRVGLEDLHLFAIIAEKAYEGQSHWLMFLFRCRRRLDALPPDISEGRFAFYSRAAIDQPLRRQGHARQHIARTRIGRLDAGGGPQLDGGARIDLGAVDPDRLDDHRGRRTTGRDAAGV